MSDPRTPGDLPPDLPPEYAEAYRRGYERAYLEASAQAAEPEPLPAPEPVLPPEPLLDAEPVPEPEADPGPDVTAVTIRGPLFADDYAAAWADDDVEPTRALPLDALAEAREESWPPDPVEPAGMPEVAPQTEPQPRWGSDVFEQEVFGEGSDDPPADRPGWFVPALLGGLVLVLVLGAYGIGRMLSSSVGDADVSTEEPVDGVVVGGGSGDDGSRSGAGREAAAYQGAVEAVPIGGATATCQAPSSVDAAGNEIGYPPSNAIDGDLTTAWRCNGRGVGQSLTLMLAEPVTVGEVGLVPGYAKTDPRSGVDRYAENNRITRVRWTFPDGSSVVQRLDGAATNRSVQTMRIEPRQAGSLVMEVLASTPGPRNTVAVSEVSVSRTLG